MHRYSTPDAMQLLAELAAAHPEVADLAFEAWVLGFSPERMTRAIGYLRASGFVVDCFPGQTDSLASCVRLTARGLAAAHATVQAPSAAPRSSASAAAIGEGKPRGTERRAGRDRRADDSSSAPAPTGNFRERRQGGQDRRATSRA